MNFLIAQKDLTPGKVCPEIVHGEDGLLCGMLSRSMTQCDTDPRQKFTRVEGLGQVVVGPGVERPDFVLLLFPRRDDDNGRLRPLAQPFGYFQSVHVGKTQVKQHHVGTACDRLHQPFPGGGRLNEAITMALEGDTEEAAHLRLVFDQ
jgi:hypothetical protein